MTLTDEELSRWIVERIPEAKHLGGDRQWYPNDMVHDPAMTLMLLERLLSDGNYECIIASDGIEMGAELEAPHQGKQSFLVSLRKNTLGRAVAEAWAIANGWTP
jgi:hypothetical protein